MRSRIALAFGLAACASCGTPTGASDAARDGASDTSARTDGAANGDARIVDGNNPFDSSADVVDVAPFDSGATDSALTDASMPTDVPRSDSGSACRPYVDMHAAERTACTYAAGALAADTLGDITAARGAIQHLIILLHENRSLDHYFGFTGHGIEGVPPTFTNPNASGMQVRPFHYSSGCACDPPHGMGQIVSEWNNGAMDGFIRTDGMTAFGYYTDDDHPFYTWLMTSFSTSDRYFCSALGDTGHNRHFLWHAAGTVGGSIFTSLSNARVNWVNFYDRSAPLYNDLGANTGPQMAHLHPDPGLAEFYAALADPTGASLPQLSIIDQPADEHPTADINRGEAATRTVVQNVLASPSWPHIAMIFTYDEAGGFFDHVPPPRACVATTATTEAAYDNLGIRVPIAVLSPYAIPGHVSHVAHSHTSITRLIELLYGLPALTKRDANSDALLDMFDFGCPRLMTPPSPIPAAGATGCPAGCASGP